MSDEHEAARGPLNLADRPWWREVIRCCGDPEVETITIPASTQVGKTLQLCAIILYLARNAPASGLAVLPDKVATTEFRDRLYSLAKESGFQIPPEYKWNLRYMNIGSMRLYLAWSGSKQGLRGRRCKYVFLSEIDVYSHSHNAGNPIESASQRVKAFPRHLIFRESSPIPEPSPIDKLYQQSDRRRWECICPHCGKAQEVRFFVEKEGPNKGCGGFGGLTDEHGNWLDPEVARTSAHYVCIAGCKISDTAKRAFMASGRWVAGRVNRRNVGFHLWAVHSHATWGKIAAEYLRQRAEGGLADFFQNWLGLCYKTRGSMPHWKTLGRRLATVGHLRGTVPSDAWFLLASGDVQENELYCAVRAFGDMKTSWLVDWFVFDREDDAGDLVKSDFAQLSKHVLRGTWPVAGGKNPRGKSQLAVAMIGVDSKYRTTDVHHWIVSEQRSPRVRAVQGDGNMQGVRFKNGVSHEARRAKKDGTREKYEGGLELWSINSTDYRRDLAERFNAAADQPGAWLLPADIMEGGQFYLRQLVNEPPTWIKRKKDGRPQLVFQERDKTLGHDFWDVEVNMMAIADMFVDQLPGKPGWSAKHWARAGQQREPAESRPRKVRRDRAAR